MTTVTIYNREGNATKDIQVPEFFSTPWNPSLVHQVFKSYAANRRRGTAHTKIRSEVSGGGKKPWAQKGTGRARHGSSRSPIWRHGGVTFGPRVTTDFSQKINKKMSAQAFAAALSYKLTQGQLKVVAAGAFDAVVKTKELAGALKNMTQGKTALFVVPEKSVTVQRAAQNIARVTTVTVNNLNIYDILTHWYIIMNQNTFDAIGAKQHQ
ncbi:MAG: 50S ribosomal protein L4 [bacterium]|nr:50S ribosomal protein L4 [bacterium]